MGESVRVHAHAMSDSDYVSIVAMHQLVGERADSTSWRPGLESASTSYLTARERHSERGLTSGCGYVRRRCWQAIAGHGDCFYGDGVQVGAFARFLLGYVYHKSGDTEKAKPLFDEIRKDFPDAVDHRGRSLVEQLPPDKTAEK